MLRSFKYLLVGLMVCLGLELQAQADQLPQTVLFKVKDAHRGVCFTNRIDNDLMNSIFSEIDLNTIQKVFPNKLPERTEGFTDLSLIYQVSYKKDVEVDQVVQRLSKLDILEYVQPYYLPQLCYTPSDTDITNQYYLSLIEAYNAWDIQQGDTNIVIGITDTGWDPTHPDLLGNVKLNYADPINGSDDDLDGYTDNYMGWDLANNDNDALWESLGHGVHVTGLAAAVTDNTTGVASVGFNTKFLPVKISNAAGILTHSYQGIVYAADHGCAIINCSWGSYNAGQFERDIVDYAINNKGCIVIGAAGNDNGEGLFYPASFDGVMSVAATDQSDLKKNNSNFGYRIDISAPGEAMYSTTILGTYGNNGGTSMAAPLVAGACAIVKAQFPIYTNHQVTALLKATADDIDALNTSYVEKLGSGRLNLDSAITAINPQWIEMTSKTIVDNNNNTFTENDTLVITGVFTNFLSSINGTSVNLTSVSPYVNVIDGSTSLPPLNMLSTANNSTDPFKIEILTGGGINEVVTFKVEITNGSHTYNQYFDVVINPDYINVEINQVSTSITSIGKIGYNNTANTVGLGFLYQGKQLLYEAGLMIGDGSSRVADCVRGTPTQEQDFSSMVNVKYRAPYVSDLDLDGMIQDWNMANPLDLFIRHYTYAYSSAPDDKYVIVAYDIENNSSNTYTNLYAGIFADWDIENAMLNKAGVDVSREMGYVYYLDSDSLYAGIKVLTGSGSNYAFDNLAGGAGGIDISDGFDKAEKFGSLSTSRNTAGGVVGNDVAHTVSAGPFTLNPGGHQVVAFALLAGDSLNDLQTSADAAQTKYNTDGLSVEDLIRDQKISLYPNPGKGLIHIQSELPMDGIKVYNALGSIVYQEKRGVSFTVLDLNHLPKGSYRVQLEIDQKLYFKKLILID